MQEELWWPFICRVGQNRIYTLDTTVYLVISLPKLPYINRIYVVLANPIYLSHMLRKDPPLQRLATACELLLCMSCMGDRVYKYARACQVHHIHNTTHSLTHSLTHALTHSRTHALIYTHACAATGHGL